MNREIKFRAFDTREGLKRMFYNVSFVPYGEGWNDGNPNYKFYELTFGSGGFMKATAKDIVLMQYVGLKDKNGVEIYEGDVLEFADKWEWYKGSYGIKMHFAEPERLKELQRQYDKEPMERRVIEMPECYNWLLSSEIQTYWHVIGNIYESPILTPQP